MPKKDLPLTEDDVFDSALERYPVEDVLHAYRQHFVRWPPDERDPDFVMVTGPSRSGELLEIGVIVEGGRDDRIIHSMPAREKFLLPAMRPTKKSTKTKKTTKRGR